jgi:hypothetical protein
MITQLTLLADLSDDQLLAEVQRIVARERQATAALLRSLIELDARRLYLREGCASLFTYCTQVLDFSSSITSSRTPPVEAQRRKTYSYAAACTTPMRRDCSSGAMTTSCARRQSYGEFTNG